MDSWVQHETSEEGRRTYQPKCCVYNNKDEVNSSNILITIIDLHHRDLDELNTSKIYNIYTFNIRQKSRQRKNWTLFLLLPQILIKLQWPRHAYEVIIFLDYCCLSFLTIFISSDAVIFHLWPQFTFDDNFQFSYNFEGKHQMAMQFFCNIVKWQSAIIVCYNLPPPPLFFFS